jgi:hypothetical protein
MAIILKVNKVNLFVSSVLFVFWYHSPNFLDTPYRSSALQNLIQVKQDYKINLLAVKAVRWLERGILE